MDAYFARYPLAAEFITQTIEQASKNQKVTTMLGRERILSDWESSPGARAASGRLAVNTRIQGSAAELIKLAMLNISDEMRSRGLKVVYYCKFMTNYYLKSLQKNWKR